MITKIKLCNFKCFQNIELELSKVNILSGINGVGKSTIIQSLLLLRQSYQKEELKKLCLNGKYVSLGDGIDILYEKAEQDCIQFEILNENNEVLKCYAEIEPKSDSFTCLSNVTADMNFTFLASDCVYLNALRIAPRKFYQMEPVKELQSKEYGIDGEFALQYLKEYGDKIIVEDQMILQDSENAALMNQVRLWMQQIAPSVEINVELNSALDISELRYEFVEGRYRTNAYRAINVGFGLTYVLPVVVAILSAKPGELVIVENPEAHLHPAGQTKMGELIALAGAAGIQLIVETHSDHVVNGLRRMVKNEKILPKETKLMFFYKDEEDGYKHKVIMPEIRQDGRLNYWPKGFFDEWDKALYELM